MVTRPIPRSYFVAFSLLLVLVVVNLQAQPVNAPVMPLRDLKPGMKGEVWTVFKGTQAESFAVEVTGIVQNALGPGKALIVCELTDPRVQAMGAVAGMSGSPLYVDGQLAGALSYQLQRFETVRYAGFTPIADLMEVSKLADINAAHPAPIPLKKGLAHTSGEMPATRDPIERRDLAGDFQPLRPVFSLGGVSPQVSALFADNFRALGLEVSALGGSNGDSANAAARPMPALQPGSAVSVALATGDISLAGTGTVSLINGNKMIAFGHPVLNLGDTELPMAAAEIVAILPSSMSSFKVANTGAVIGTISQDRLSAISGEIGREPTMVPVEVTVHRRDGTETLHYRVAQQAQLTPVLAATGLAQAILNSNAAGLEEGFQLSRTAEFGDGVNLTRRALYPGPQGFAQGIDELLHELTACTMNPFEKTFPTRIAFNIEALDHNPAATLDLFQLNRTHTHPGDTVQISLAWRDYRGEEQRDNQVLTVDSAWVGKTLEVVLMPGRALDELTGAVPTPAQARNFSQYVSALSDARERDGLYLAVLERATVFVDQTVSTLDYPGSVERIARASDESRYQKREASVPLWEKHVLPGRLVQANLHRSLSVDE